MNVFILNTGRCGSLTFIRACQYITNYSSGHESRVQCLGQDRLAYPPWHIEADNRLSWFLGRLAARFPRDVCYVHLHRDPEAVARSYAKRLNSGLILPAYARGIHLYLPRDLESYALEAARDYVHTVRANIEHFLRDQPCVLDFPLETATEGFPRFWERIGAEGDLAAALATFQVRHNASTDQSNA